MGCETTYEILFLRINELQEERRGKCVGLGKRKDSKQRNSTIPIPLLLRSLSHKVHQIINSEKLLAYLLLVVVLIPNRHFFASFLPKSIFLSSRHIASPRLASYNLCERLVFTQIVCFQWRSWVWKVILGLWFVLQALKYVFTHPYFDKFILFYIQNVVVFLHFFHLNSHFKRVCETARLSEHSKVKPSSKVSQLFF